MQEFGTKSGGVFDLILFGPENVPELMANAPLDSKARRMLDALNQTVTQMDKVGCWCLVCGLTLRRGTLPEKILLACTEEPTAPVIAMGFCDACIGAVDGERPALLELGLVSFRKLYGGEIRVIDIHPSSGTA